MNIKFYYLFLFILLIIPIFSYADISTATISSSIYTIDQNELTITNVPYNTSLNDFLLNILKDDELETFILDGLKDPIQDSSNILGVISGDGLTTLNYKVTPIPVNDSTLISSDIYIITDGNISNVPLNTTKEEFLSHIFKDNENQSFVVEGINDTVLNGNNLLVLAQSGQVMDYAININQIPNINSLWITGTSSVGSTITAYYVYHDNENDLEGESIFGWYRNGVLIPNTHKLFYLLTEEDKNCKIEFRIKPIALTGTNLGEEKVVYFNFDTNYQVVYNMNNFSGGNQEGNVIEYNGSLYGINDFAGESNRGTIFKWDGSTMSVLYNLQDLTGTAPFGSLVRSPDGNFYGMTNQGGEYDLGVIFKLSGNTYSVLHHFSPNLDDGNYPSGSLILGNDGALYGLTMYGGSYNKGTIFKWDGSFNLLYSFDGINGSYPEGDLMIASDGNFYGMTSSNLYNRGTVFKWDGNTYSVLHSFMGGINDGAAAYYGPLTEDRNNPGTFYGLTGLGGLYYKGVIFKISNNIFSLVHSFDGNDGMSPTSAMIQDDSGIFYGMTTTGGYNEDIFHSGVIFKLDNDIFSVAHYFDGAQGSRTFGKLLKSVDGNFYGLTAQGGSNNMGVLFRFNPNGINIPLNNVSVNNNLVQSGGYGSYIVNNNPPTVNITNLNISSKSIDYYLFNKDLKIGNISEDVKYLQKYLNNHGFIVSEKGLGSIGYESNFFGPLTKKSLIKFQKAKGINPSFGYLGLKTRTYINLNK